MPRRKQKTEEIIRNSKKSKVELADDKDDEENDLIDYSSNADIVDQVDTNNAKDSDYSDFEKMTLPKVCGEVLVTGGMNWSVNGRSKARKGDEKNQDKGRDLYSYHRCKSLCGIKVAKVISGPTANHNILMTSEGKAYAWGRNEMGQLGNGGTERVDVPTPISSFENTVIVDAACGRNHTLCLTDTGIVYGFGDNQFGQVGVGGKMVVAPTKVRYDGPPVIDVGCGAQFSMLVNCRGHVYSFGCTEYGQLGHNTDGKYFASGNKLAFNNVHKPERIMVWLEKSKAGNTVIKDAEIVKIECGTNHTVAMDKKKRLFTWGFGGFGRLGHTEQKDEMVPRLVELFARPSRGAVDIFAGNQCTIARNELGGVFFWGVQGNAKDNTMYPKPISDLYGWDVRSISSGGKHIVVAADNTIIAWGSGVSNGELGLGANRKSSANPDIVKDMEGTHVLQVACGQCHTIAIARNKSDEEKKKIEKFPVYNLA